MAATTKIDSTPPSGGQTNNSDALKPVNPEELAMLRRRMNGARRGVARLEEKLSDLTEMIERKSVALPKKEGDETVRYRLINADELPGYRGKELELKQELAKAKRDHKLYRRDFRSASRRNNKVMKSALSDFHKQARLEDSVPRFIEESVAIIGKIKESAPDSYRVIVAPALAGEQKNFRVTFDETLKASDSALHETISVIGTVKTKVIRGVMKRLVKLEVPDETTDLRPEKAE